MPGDRQLQRHAGLGRLDAEDQPLPVHPIPSEVNVLEFSIGAVKSGRKNSALLRKNSALLKLCEPRSLPIRLTPMTATCRVPPLSRVKLGIGWSRGVARDAERCSGGTCGSAGRQGGFQSGTALPPCRSAGRQSRLPSGLSPGRRRRPHHRGKVAGTRVANAGMGDRRGREHPWRAPLYPVCAHSSPSGCGSKPDREASKNARQSTGHHLVNTADRVPARGVRALRSTRLPAGRAGTFRLPRWAA